VSGEEWRAHEEYARGNTGLVENVRLLRQRGRMEESLEVLNEQAAVVWRSVLDSLGDYVGKDGG
jgi:hypothetical protein